MSSCPGCSSVPRMPKKRVGRRGQEAMKGIRINRPMAFYAAVATGLASLLLSATLTSPAGLAATDTRSGPASAGQPPATPQSQIPPPPRVKPAPDFNGRTDLPNDYERGAIKLKIRTGRSISDVLSQHGLTGRYRYLSPPPFSPTEVAVGIDRNYWVEVPVGLEKSRVSALAKNTADFEWVQMLWLPNGTGALLAPNDPKYTSVPSGQPYLAWINMERAWDRTVSSGSGPGSIVVAILDSGLYASHEDSGVWKQRSGWDYLAGASMPAGQATDSGCAYGHGTKTSTIAAGDTNNSKGIAATGFNSGLLPEKVLNSSCAYAAMASGSITYDWPVRWAVAQGAHVINMSYDLGTYLPPELLDALTSAWASGVTPVASAGNANVDHRVTHHYPCDSSYVICVGAVQDSSGTKWSLSDYGAGYVDVMAPGVSILGVTNQGTADYRYDSGTSYASPLTAGVFALLRAIGKSPDQQWTAIASTAQYPGGDPNGYSSYGLINAGAALWY